MQDKPKIDRRVQRTRQILQEALLALILEKGYDAITVQDVIDRANVGRATFYSHYQDKDALFLSGFESLRDQFEQHLSNQSPLDGDPWNLSLMMFQHAQSHLRIYKAIVGKQGGNVALGHIHKYLSALIQEHFNTQFSERKNAKVPPDVLAHFMVSSFMALLTWWLDHDLPYPAERMNEMFRQLTQPGIENILQ
jgi:AcrR family transcriptional regulator